MTNREWLNSLNNSDLAIWLLYVMPKISTQYTQSHTGLHYWLNQEYGNDWTNKIPQRYEHHNLAYPLEEQYDSN